MRPLPLMRWFLVGLGIAGLVGLVLIGMRGGKSQRPPFELFPDMDRQPKFKSQQPSRFFADGRADRSPVAGTIPFGVLIKDPYFISGKMGVHWGDGIPVTVNRPLIDRGRERFDINCKPCHGALADGKGIVQQYNFNIIADLHQQRIAEMADGEIFNTIAHGKNQMGPYPHITPDDRWAIIAYLRVLQKSRKGAIGDVPPAERAKLEAMKAEAPAAAGTTNAPSGAAAPPTATATNAPSPGSAGTPTNAPANAAPAQPPPKS